MAQIECKYADQWRIALHLVLPTCPLICFQIYKQGASYYSSMQFAVISGCEIRSRSEMHIYGVVSTVRCTFTSSLVITLSFSKNIL